MSEPSRRVARALKITIRIYREKHERRYFAYHAAIPETLGLVSSCTNEELNSRYEYQVKGHFWDRIMGFCKWLSESRSVLSTRVVIKVEPGGNVIHPNI